MNFSRTALLLKAVVAGTLSLSLPIISFSLDAADPPIQITPGPSASPDKPKPPTITPDPNPSLQNDPRSSIPSPLEQSKARTVVEHAFKEQFAAQQSRQGRMDLAAFLLEKGSLTEDDPTARYVMLQQARTLAIELGETGIAIKCIDELVDSHQLNGLEEQLDAMRKLEKTVRGSEAQGELVRMALRGMREAARRDDFLTARQFQHLAESSARKSHVRELNAMVKTRIAEMAGLQEEFSQIQPALKALILNASDPGANLLVGRYYGMSHGDWNRAIPMLAKSNESTLRRLAELELQPMSEPASQLEVADGWWKLGESLPAESLQRKYVLRHAFDWYKVVHPRLQGISESRVYRLLQDYQSMPERITFEEQEEFGDIVFLSDLAPTRIDVMRQAFGNEGRRSEGDLLKLKGKWFRKSLCTPPPPRSASSVVYELPHTNFQYFRSTIGVDDQVGNRLKSPLVFEVWGDQQLLWRSDPVTRAAAVQTCRVKILGVRSLELKVVCPGSDEYAWPVWADPRVMMR